MAFSLACDSGKDTLRIEGADSGVTWNDVANAGAGSVAVDGGGTEDTSYFVTEHIADGMYEIHTDVEFGDGTNSLEFLSRNEAVYFDDGQTFAVKNNATLELGELSADGGAMHGAWWRVKSSGNFDIISTGQTGAVFNMYGSEFFKDGTAGTVFRTGTIDIVSGLFTGAGGGYHPIVLGGSVDFADVIFSDTYGPRLDVALNAGIDLKSVSNNHGVIGYAESTLQDVEFIDCGHDVSMYNLGSTDVLAIINPQEPLATPNYITGDDGAKVKEQFKVNILVRYDGSAVENATVKLYDKNSTEIFSKTTDANGEITEQTVTARHWEVVSSALSLTDYNDFTLEISKSGYPSYTQSGIILEEPISWEIEMPISNSDLLSALTDDDTKIEAAKLARAARLLLNKAVQDKSSGAVVYYDDDGSTPLITHTPSDDGSEITRTPS